MKILLLGAPGCGKSTQAKLITDMLNVPHISTGDMLREEIKSNSKSGQRAKIYISQGGLVPDDIIFDIVKKRLQNDDCKNGFILDAYPRNPSQAMELAKITKLDLVLYLKVDNKKVIDRLSNRLTCTDCQKSVPKSSGYANCPYCGGNLVQRPDDAEDVIKVRLETYEKQTKPLIEYYDKVSNLVVIDADQEVEKVFNDIKMAINRK